jgi:hypothetical protein
MDFAIGIIQNAMWSVIAAILTVGYFYVLKNLRYRAFHSVFGYNVQDSNDIIITVPLWKALENTRTAPRFLKRQSHANYEELYGPSEMYSREDVVAAAHILSIIEKHLKKEVCYKNDSEEIIWGKGTIVIIGAPIANYHADCIINSDPIRKLNNIPAFIDCEENDETKCRSYIFNPLSNKKYISTDNRDYGMVIRFPNVFADSPGYYIFVVGGIHAESTRESGKMFNENWKKLSNKDGISGFIFEMSRGIPGTGRIVEEISSPLSA